MGINEINAFNVCDAYVEAKWNLRVSGKEEETERGLAIVMPEPAYMCIESPRQRVLFDPMRDANPYFHLMEAIWMLAGRDDAKWVGNFNRRIYDSQEADGRIHGAYGHRWRNSFHRDQLVDAVKTLRADSSSRRAVISMWDPRRDNSSVLNDRPCNTHIYLRIRNGRLEMTVCSRSNDLFWGMLGANVVHMTFLQEFLARALGVELGVYQVFTNNLHAYKKMPRFEEVWAIGGCEDWYASKRLVPNYLEFGDSGKFLHECELFCAGRFDKLNDPFLRNVAAPMYDSWMARKAGEDPYAALRLMPPENDWRCAAREWLARHVGQLVVAA